MKIYEWNQLTRESDYVRYICDYGDDCPQLMITYDDRMYIVYEGMDKPSDNWKQSLSNRNVVWMSLKNITSVWKLIYEDEA
jgi:hypothetical protein